MTRSPTSTTRIRDPQWTPSPRPGWTGGRDRRFRLTLGSLARTNDPWPTGRLRPYTRGSTLVESVGATSTCPALTPHGSGSLRRGAGRGRPHPLSLRLTSPAPRRCRPPGPSLPDLDAATPYPAPAPLGPHPRPQPPGRPSASPPLPDVRARPPQPPRRRRAPRPRPHLPPRRRHAPGRASERSAGARGAGARRRRTGARGA